MNAKHIVGALPILARLLANECKVELFLGCKVVSTTKDSIRLPALPKESPILGPLALGYIVRESSRIRNNATEIKYQNRLVDVIYLILNEIWIELCAQRQFPGAKRTLEELMSVLIQEALLPPMYFLRNPVDSICVYLDCFVRCSVLKQTQLLPIMQYVKSDLDQIFDESVLEGMVGIALQVGLSRDHESNYKLAKEIEAYLLSQIDLQRAESNGGEQSINLPIQSEDLQEETSNQSDDSDQVPSQRSMSSQQEDSSEKDSIENAADSHSENSNSHPADDDHSDQDHLNESEMEQGLSENGENDQATKGSKESNQDVDGEGDSETSDQTSDNRDHTVQSANDAQNGDGNRERDRQTDDQQHHDSKRKAQSTMLHLQAMFDKRWDMDTVNQNVGDHIQRLAQHEKNGDKFVIANQVKCHEGVDASHLIHATRVATGALRAKMELLLQSQNNVKRMIAKRGKIIPSRVWKTRLGNMRVFENVEEKPALNTSVLFLVDCSESMKSSGASVRDYIALPRINLAVQSILAMAMSIDGQRHVNVASVAFPMFDKVIEKKNGVSVLTDFHESVVQTASRYASLDASGSTPMAEAILFSTYKLLAQKSERKMLFVLTDGFPDKMDSAKTALATAQSLGVETFGIGIGLDIQSLIPSSEGVYQLDDMPKVIFDMLHKQLRKQAA